MATTAATWTEPKPFTFEIDPVDAPPVLFHKIRVPCACGRSLDQCRYTFFPTAVFVHGVCVECGDQSAIFAPHIEQTQLEPMGDRIARQMARLLRDMAHAYGAETRDVIGGFVDYLASVPVDPQHYEDPNR